MVVAGFEVKPNERHDCLLFVAISSPPLARTTELLATLGVHR
eukprot:COSAG02_NODE_37090_length_446_cov_1.227666_1_plen_41_part_10